MFDNPPTETQLLQLWALLDAHLICVINGSAAVEGWLIDGVSVQLPMAKEATGGATRPRT
ncbi:hypothetical protein DMH04_14065 [Kibdelosporangium aridum]|uniref:Uncharacterized protein n=1 Tax=Kibdelosporangium aridum TaxID=2030 RepID=A0A428ZE02_KIBAR|nr:hypothetical protein [Kibdelosporangium aridum]RSM86289.1 hypothetical protein DMH04_14065 [Kibdelosporangium aridum]